MNVQIGRTWRRQRRKRTRSTLIGLWLCKSTVTDNQSIGLTRRLIDVFEQVQVVLAESDMRCSIPEQAPVEENGTPVVVDAHEQLAKKYVDELKELHVVSGENTITGWFRLID